MMICKGGECVRPEFQALIDAFQLEYDALLRQKGQQ